MGLNLIFATSLLDARTLTEGKEDQNVTSNANPLKCGIIYS